MIFMNNSTIDVTLDRLGFTLNSYVETILVTRNSDSSYNAAPMGVIRTINGLKVKPFNSTKTCFNLHNGNRASINITSDPVIFLKTAFKEELKEFFRVKDWVFDGIDATIMAKKLREVRFSDIRTSFTLDPVKISIYRKEPVVFSRGRSEAIEAVIHTTRVKAFHYESRDAEVEKLVEKLKASFDVINRVSSKDSPEASVMRSIKRLLDEWGVDI
jgi:hypothetical protein